MSDRNGAWRGAAPWGAAPHLGTICLEVQKSAWATQSRTDAWNYIFIYRLSNFTFVTRLSLRGSYTFFNWCKSWVLCKKWKISMATYPPICRLNFNTTQQAAINSYRQKLISQTDVKRSLPCLQSYLLCIASRYEIYISLLSRQKSRHNIDLSCLLRWKLISISWYCLNKNRVLWIRL